MTTLYTINLCNCTHVFSIRDGNTYSTTNLVSCVNGDRIAFDNSNWYLWDGNVCITCGEISMLKVIRRSVRDGYEFITYDYTAIDRISV